MYVECKNAFRTERYDNSFFLFCINNWNTLDDTIKSAPSLKDLKSNLCKFVRPHGNTFYTIRDKFGIKLLRKIRVSFSDLRDHQFNHNFDCMSPMCSCGVDEETSIHYFLSCSRFIGYITPDTITPNTITPNTHYTEKLNLENWLIIPNLVTPKKQNSVLQEKYFFLYRKVLA